MIETMTPEIEPTRGLFTMGVAALIGGAARQAHQWLSGKAVTWKHFLFRAVVSVFIGFVSYYALPSDKPWTYAACGLFSWLGADGVSLLMQLVVKHNNRKNGDD